MTKALSEIGALMMTITEADEIRMEVGKFFEYVNPVLMKVFLGNIPEFLLPYPKDKIFDAMEIMKDYFKDAEFTRVADSIVALLMMYIDSATALSIASKKFQDPKHVEAIYSYRR